MSLYLLFILLTPYRVPYRVHEGEAPSKYRKNPQRGKNLGSASWVPGGRSLNGLPGHRLPCSFVYRLNRCFRLLAGDLDPGVQVLKWAVVGSVFFLDFSCDIELA